MAEANLNSHQSIDLTSLWEMLPDDPSPQIIEKLLDETSVELNQKNIEMNSKLLSQQTAMANAQLQIQELAEIVKQTKQVCTTTKDNVKDAKIYLATGNLNIMSLYQKREQYIALENDVQNLKKLLTLRMEIATTMKEGDYHKVIIQCINCSNLLKEYSSLECLEGIPMNVNHQLIQVKKMLEIALGELCRPPFKEDLFLKVIKALRLTKKSNSVLRRITSNFQKYIDSATRSTVISHVIDLDNSEEIKTMKFKDLITFLKEDNFSSCFSLILYQMSEIMYLTYQMIESCKSQITLLGNTNGIYYCELLEGLKQNKKTLWDKMERNTTAFCVPNRLRAFKLDNFLLLLDSLNVFVNIGEQFSGDTSHRLRGFIVQLSTAFYEKFHMDNLSTIKSMLVSENWTMCPGIHPQYSIRDIREVNTLLNEVKSSGNNLTKSPSTKGNKFFEMYQDNGNPFVPKKRRISVATYGGGQIEIDVESNAEDLIYNQQKLEREMQLKNESKMIEIDSRDKKRRGQPDQGPLLATTTISIIKCLSKYLQMMKILNHISWTICQGLIQIINTYQVTIITYFMQNQTITALKMSANLKTFLDQTKEQNSSLSVVGIKNLYTNLKIDTKIDQRPDKMFGMEPLIIGTESLMFMQQSLMILKPLLQYLIPKPSHQSLLNFYTLSVDTIPEQRNLIFKGIMNKYVSVDNIVQSMQSVNWSTNDFQTRKSAVYIDKMTNLLQIFNKRLDGLLETSFEPMPYRVRKYIWDHMTSHIAEVLIEGFSVSNCSTDGRAMMGIDLQNIIQIIESISELKINSQLLKLTENYIKAYYQPAEEVETWVSMYINDYSLKQLRCLIECGSWDAELKKNLIKKFITK